MAATAKRNPDRATGGAADDSFDPVRHQRLDSHTAHKANPEAAGLVLLALALLFDAICWGL